MSKRQPIPSAMRRSVFRRDDYRCVKCGRTHDLQVHHIVPVYMGGGDNEGNGITLCYKCHLFAPDNPVALFKWAVKHLPPDMEQAVSLSKIFISLIFHKYNMKDKTKEAEALIDELSADMWGIFVSNDISKMSDLFRKIEAQNKEDDLNAETTNEQRQILPNDTKTNGGKEEVG